MNDTKRRALIERLLTVIESAMESDRVMRRAAILYGRKGFISESYEGLLKWAECWLDEDELKEWKNEN